MIKLPSISDLKNIFWERNVSGENWYTVENDAAWGLDGNNMYIAENHPILTPALVFVSKLFSQAEFYMENKETKERLYDHEILTMLNSPNYYQNKSDFLEALLFMKIANGASVVYKKSIIGLEDHTEAIYILDYNKITWPNDFKTTMSVQNANNKIKDVKVFYDKNGEEELEIKLDDLYFFYDMPSGVRSKNSFKVKSRLDGLKQTLINTADSLLAKNIILRTNGKELISGNSNGFPLSDDDKRDAQQLMNNRYGLSSTRSRSLVTNSNLTWKSLHIAIRDLGLDESVKVDGNIIYTALHIPKDILSLEAKKTTYNNFKESMTSYIQNEMVSTLNSFCEVINTSMSDKKWVLKGSYDHLPVMQFTQLEKYDVIKKQADAFKALIDSGFEEELALRMCGFPVGTKIKPPTQQTQVQTPT